VRQKLASERARSEQVNIRLTEGEHDVLRALAFLDNTSGADVLRDVVSSHLAQQAQDPDVRSALAALTARRARQEGRLTSLRRKAAGRDGAKGS